MRDFFMLFVHLIVTVARLAGFSKTDLCLAENSFALRKICASAPVRLFGQAEVTA